MNIGDLYLNQFGSRWLALVFRLNALDWKARQRHAWFDRSVRMKISFNQPVAVYCLIKLEWLGVNRYK
jgi:hypothetical protein